MDWNIYTVSGPPFVKVKTSGDFNLADYRRMVENIISQDFWIPGLRVLFDHKKLNFGSTSINEISGVSRTHQMYEKEIGGGKAAILMSSIAGFGRGRQLELITNDKISEKLQVFLDEKEAIDWLAL